MAALKQIELEVSGVQDLALVGSDDSVWLVVPLRWWDLSTLIWWLFVPNDKKARVKLTFAESRTAANKTKVSFRAVRVASKHIRVGVVGSK